MQLRAEVDARERAGELQATEMVGGIPLAIRALRQLARRGWNGARVVTADEAAAGRVRDALARFPVPASLAVEVVTAADAATPSHGHTALALDGRAIYRTGDLPAPGPATGAAPEPILRVRTRADAAAAERALFELIKKSVDDDGLISYHVIRPIARRLTRALLPTPVTPNQVTGAALACALAAAALAASGGGRGVFILAGALYWLGGAIDHVDGELARLRLQSSKLGEWLDSMTDEISTYSLLIGLGVGLWRDGAGPIWLLVGPGAALIGVLTMARIYADLHRMGLPIDSAMFPWFFAQPDPGDAAPREPTALARVLRGLGFLIRRDANVTGVSLMLLLGWRELATALVAAGAAAGAIVTLTHYVVVALRARTR